MFIYLIGLSRQENIDARMKGLKYYILVNPPSKMLTTQNVLTLFMYSKPFCRKK